MADYSQLEAVLGYRFTDHELLTGGRLRFQRKRVSQPGR